jgi:hypothetical protein
MSDVSCYINGGEVCVVLSLYRKGCCWYETGQYLESYAINEDGGLVKAYQYIDPRNHDKTALCTLDSRLWSVSNGRFKLGRWGNNDDVCRPIKVEW